MEASERVITIHNNLHLLLAHILDLSAFKRWPF